MCRHVIWSTVIRVLRSDIIQRLFPDPVVFFNEIFFFSGGRGSPGRWGGAHSVQNVPWRVCGTHQERQVHLDRCIS